MNEQIHNTFIITNELDGQRLDLALSNLLPDYSRSLIQKWINSQQILLNKKNTKTKVIVRAGDQIDIKVTITANNTYEPIDIPLDIIYEDEELIVINKPAKQIVHPGAGNPTGTLLNGLIYKYPKSKILPRAGIVHRLDKDTTGLMVIAKTLPTYYKLVENIKNRTIIRIYEAICYGILEIPGKITEPIGRHPTNRTKMSVNLKGKPAETRFEIIKKLKNFTWLKLQLITGRTHQIRVHLSHIRHPIVGDQTYANNRNIKNLAISTAINKLGRQALHARQLSFTHPITKKELSFKTELPKDIRQLINILQNDEY